MRKKPMVQETAESLAGRQREISVSEFFLKNRHLLGFDNPRKALMTTVKEAVDNALDACEEAGILPQISVEIQQTADTRFRVSITDNGPGIVRAQIPKIFAKLLYGSKFHRLRMSRGQQGIGISAAGMYGQLTTGTSTRILSRTKGSKTAHAIDVQIDTRKNMPTILKDEESDWHPVFYQAAIDGKPVEPVTAKSGTCVTIEMEAAYVRGRLSVDEYLKQCAVVNPHLQLHYRIVLTRAAARDEEEGRKGSKAKAAAAEVAEEPAPGNDVPWTTFLRATNQVPDQPQEIKPHPHGVELGMLMQMLKNSPARTVRAALSQDFSRVSEKTALEICERAKLNPKANPTRIAHQESEALFKAIAETKLMRPPMDCLSPIGEAAIEAGLRKEIVADFYTAVTRSPTVYRGNPFLVEAGLAYAKPGAAPVHGGRLLDEQGRRIRELESLRPIPTPRIPPARADGADGAYCQRMGAVHQREQGGGGPLPGDHQGTRLLPAGMRAAPVGLPAQAPAPGGGGPETPVHGIVYSTPGAGLEGYPRSQGS